MAMRTMKKAVGIILAGGAGNRFEADVPKQFCLLNGRMVLEHSVAVFRESGLFSKIIVVLPPQWKDNPKAALGDANIVGGQTRNESTWAALQACDPDTELVLTHDAARPFVTVKILADCIEALASHEAVDVCIPADDTIVQVGADGFIENIPDRRRLMRGQTPQGFHYAKLRAAYEANINNLNATDDVSVFLRLGGRCAVVEGSSFNFKLTYPQDLFFAEKAWQYRPASAPAQPDLAGKRVLLLGASGGIGRVVHRLLVERGCEVAAPTHAELDLARVPIPSEFAQPWDAIIHSAGILNGNSDAAGVEAIFNANFRSVVAVTDLARHCMRGGAIVVVGSSSAMKGRESFPLYAASKAAVNNFVEGIAGVLWREARVRINCINPGCVNTRMTSGAVVTNKDPLEPDEVAETIVAYTDPPDTGQIVNIRKYVPVASATTPAPSIKRVA